MCSINPQVTAFIADGINVVPVTNRQVSTYKVVCVKL